MNMTSKYGFDYFSQRVEILSEMAGRPSPLVGLGPHGEIAAEIFKEIGPVMRKGGEVNGEFVPGMGGNREKNRQLRYFIYMMTGMDVEETEDDISDTEANYEIVSAATEILGVDKDSWKKIYRDPDKLYRAAIMKGVDGTYRNYITTPEFRKKTLDPENILSYLSSNRVSNVYSHTKAAEREERHGMSAEEIDHAETGNKDLIAKIHRAMAYKKMKKQPELAKVEGDNVASNEFVDNAYLIVDALENLIDNSSSIKQMIDGQLSKFQSVDEDTFEAAVEDILDEYPNLNKEYIITLYDSDTKLLNALHTAYNQMTETGVDLNEFYKKLEEFKSKNSESVKNLVDLLIYEIEELQKNIEMVSKYDVDESSTDEFPGYPNDILEKFLTTPELKQQFGKFHKWLTTEMENKLRKLQDKLNATKWGENEVPGELDIVRKAEKEFFDKRPEAKKQNFQQPNQVQKELGQATRNESYVMSYMTEQVSKDKFKPIGEFKDRGFKKASNYWQGR